MGLRGDTTDCLLGWCCHSSTLIVTRTQYTVCTSQLYSVFSNTLGSLGCLELKVYTFKNLSPNLVFSLGLIYTKYCCIIHMMYINCSAERGLYVYLWLLIVCIHIVCIRVQLVLDDQLLMAEAVSIRTQPVFVHSSHYHIEHKSKNLYRRTPFTLIM